MNKVAVIMSVYKNDSSAFLVKSIDSILNQNEIEPDLYISVDGPVSDELGTTLKTYNDFDRVSVYENAENKGLAFRMNELIDILVAKGVYLYVARMDADDVCCLDRLKVQVAYLDSNEKVDVVGSDVIEIDERDQQIFYKKMIQSHDELIENIIKKCPFNHPTVLFRMSIFNEGFRYKSHLLNTQDYYLWVDLAKAGKIFANVNLPLLYFRVNESFHSRRGIKKAINDVKSRVYCFNKLGNFSISNVTHVILLAMLRVSPAFVKRLVYKFFR